MPGSPGTSAAVVGWVTMMRVASLVVALIVLAGCGSGDGGSAVEATIVGTTAPAVQRHPDVIDAVATDTGDGWRFDVTISSPYDTPDRYADAWRVVAPDGTVLGVRELLHDHQFEQPFTRSLPGVALPDGVAVVTIEARDSVNGWGGASLEITVDR